MRHVAHEGDATARGRLVSIPCYPPADERHGPGSGMVVGVGRQVVSARTAFQLHATSTTSAIAIADLPAIDDGPQYRFGTARPHPR